MMEILKEINQVDFDNPSKTWDLPLICSDNVVPSDRFKLSEDRSTFSFMGREHFQHLLSNYFLLSPRKDKVLRIIGNIGGGKTFILAAFVVRSHVLRIRKQQSEKDGNEKEEEEQKHDQRRVVYIPDCKFLLTEEENLVSILRKCLFWTFDDDNEKKEQLSAINNWKELKRFIFTLDEFSLDFVFDQWGALVADLTKDTASMQQKKEKIRQKMESLTDNQYRIEAISAGSPDMRQIRGTGSRRTGLPSCIELEIFGGLSDAEWTSWRQRDNFFPSTVINDDEKAEKVADLTGKLPLYLNRLYKYNQELQQQPLPPQQQQLPSQQQQLPSQQQQFDDLVDLLETKEAADIGANLQIFTENLCGDVLKKSRHFALMASSFAERKTGDHSRYDLYDQRYFYTKDGVVFPVSGLVRRIMAQVLRETDRQLYFQQLNQSWIHDALESTNPSVRGFAFEEYSLCRLVQYPQYVSDALSGMEVEVFYFNYPPNQSQLNQTGIRLFWPTKFNHKFVDAVLRAVIDIKQTTWQRFKKQKLDPKIIVAGIQVTLQQLQRHAGSLSFFTTNYYNHWVHQGDTPEYVFHWITNDRQNQTLPDYPSRQSVHFNQNVSVFSIE